MLCEHSSLDIPLYYCKMEYLRLLQGMHVFLCGLSGWQPVLWISSIILLPTYLTCIYFAFWMCLLCLHTRHPQTHVTKWCPMRVPCAMPTVCVNSCVWGSQAILSLRVKINILKSSQWQPLWIPAHVSNVLIARNSSIKCSTAAEHSPWVGWRSSAHCNSPSKLKPPKPGVCGMKRICLKLWS